ncbi:polysaccharide pyruvyl transferase family protein [Mesorhizobium xinjiangense]|uniref:polysaccharide pyruvyl transferase family protein n=1 Tax=Mesorhizobium xinjiangense TaxID=2678685 RepID=UPI0012ED8D32|nr:polysaccharide pyruvyl transferase family protein [Mesorhizobium xinjiangense]
MPPPSHLDLISSLQGTIRDCLKDCISGDEPVAMVDFPNYRNVGDSAIWLGQMAYLSSQFNKTPSYMSALHDFSHDALDEAMPSGPILITGGGTFGDIWPAHQELRESILERWPGRPVVQFPQSIHYRSMEHADRMARAIARHKNFVLLVRDEPSKEFAEKHFDCQVRLCPDMAFHIGPIEPLSAPRVPVLAMLRTDQEKAAQYDLTAYRDVPVEDWITESRTGIRIAKALGVAKAAASLDAERIKQAKFDAAAKARLRRGIRQISRGRAIVTDRLHVHICALLLGRPHAVLDNSYGKVRRFMDAFSGGTALSHRATSFDDAIDWARSQAAHEAGA